MLLFMLLTLYERIFCHPDQGELIEQLGHLKHPVSYLISTILSIIYHCRVTSCNTSPLGGKDWRLVERSPTTRPTRPGPLQPKPDSSDWIQICIQKKKTRDRIRRRRRRDGENKSLYVIFLTAIQFERARVAKSWAIHVKRDKRLVEQM